MGYTTDFEGSFTLDKPLTVAHLNYLKAFNEARHMKRDEAITETLPDRFRKAVGLPVGVEGGYYVEDASERGVLNPNYPPLGQPELWCQWVPTEDGMGIEHDGGEKFSGYIEWLKYLIKHFLEPWGYVLSGRVEWNGEDRKDYGTMLVTDNVVTILDE